MKLKQEQLACEEEEKREIKRRGFIILIFRNEAVLKKVDYYLMLDSTAVLDDPDTLKKLITLNK